MSNRKEDSDDRPMTEAEWEKMMREADLRAARFGEILETVQDEPKRSELLAREMGWTEMADAMKAGAEDAADDDLNITPDAAEADDEEAIDPFDDLDDETEDEMAGLPSRAERKSQLEKIPAYALSEKAATAIEKILRPYLRDNSKLSEDDGQLVGQAFMGFQIACAKISGGHAMGYDDDVLGGNIVNNKRALEGAKQAFDAAAELAQKKLISPAHFESLKPIMADAIRAIESRIAELRAKMWWE